MHLQPKEDFWETARCKGSLPCARNSFKFLTFRHSIISPFISLGSWRGFRCTRGDWAQRLMIFWGWLFFTEVTDLLLHFLGRNWNNLSVSEYYMGFPCVAESEFIQMWMKCGLKCFKCYRFLILSGLFMSSAPVQSWHKMLLNKNSPTIVAFYPGQADCITHQWPWPTRPVLLLCSWTTLNQKGPLHHQQCGPGGLSSGKLAPSDVEEWWSRTTSLICEVHCPKIKGRQVLKRTPNVLVFILLLQTSSCTWHSQTTAEKPSHYKALCKLSRS